MASVVAGLLIWILGQAFGGILAGGVTDPNSGPLLVLLALAYWPPDTTLPLIPWPPSRWLTTGWRNPGMSIPAWLLDVFAAVMLLVAAISAVQLVAGYPSRRADVDADIDRLPPADGHRDGRDAGREPAARCPTPPGK